MSRYIVLGLVTTATTAFVFFRFLLTPTVPIAVTVLTTITAVFLFDRIFHEGQLTRLGGRGSGMQILQVLQNIDSFALGLATLLPNVNPVISPVATI